LTDPERHVGDGGNLWTGRHGRGEVVDRVFSDSFCTVSGDQKVLV
jgi:hypothetical protein